MTGVIIVMVTLIVTATVLVFMRKPMVGKGILLLGKDNCVSKIIFPGDYYFAFLYQTSIDIKIPHGSSTKEIADQIMKLSEIKGLQIQIEAVEQMFPLDFLEKIESVFEGGFLSPADEEKCGEIAAEVSVQCDISFQLWIQLMPLVYDQVNVQTY